MSKVYAVDLFAGGGGLSLGLKQAGFDVIAAVELDSVACETYRINHKETIILEKDIKLIRGTELLKISPSGEIDLIAACPPCQGFSSLTHKNKKYDPRNELINEFVRIVEECLPKTIMMENVPGLVNKGKLLFENAIDSFRRIGYSIEFKVVNVADYGVPQSRRRLVVLGTRVNQEKLSIPLPTHQKNLNDSCDNEKNNLSKLERWVSTEKSLNLIKVKAEIMNINSKIFNPIDFNWHVTRKLSELNILRLKSQKAGDSRYQIPLHLRPKCHKLNNGFPNVYARMSLDQPAPTITGGCTTLSKGRFGHPVENRTISVREAALLQTFPLNYVINTKKMDAACKIIGNALPPLFAKIMAIKCKEMLKGN